LTGEAWRATVRDDMVATTDPTSPSARIAAATVARLFPEVYRRYHFARRPAGGELPVTRRALEVLAHLAAAGPLTIGEQAEHLGLRRNSTSELIARLEAKGLVSRIRDERDERRVLVWLTDAGHDVVSRIGNVLAPDLLERVMAGLEPADRAAVVRGFELLARAEPWPAPAEPPADASANSSANPAPDRRPR
jgi:DNA-binding MarR family transcriptional regulator